MKKKGLSHKVKRTFAAIGCLILAILVWLVVKYSDASEIVFAMTNLG